MKQQWKKIKGYENLYLVSNKGEIKSLPKNNKPEKILKQRLNNYGYYSVALYKNGKQKTHFVHKLIAKAFIPNPLSKPQVNHIDNNPKNNDIRNLEWTTQSENILHCSKQGRLGKGQLKSIKQLTLNGKLVAKYQSIKEAAFSVNGNRSSISRVCRGTYNHHKGFRWEYI